MVKSKVHQPDSTPQAAFRSIPRVTLEARIGPAGIRVQSPAGAEYTGFRVRTPQDETYILDKTGAPITILIFAPDPSVKALADRLAGNVGNGSGLMDDPAVSASMGALPAQLPQGMELAESNTFTAASLAGSLDQF